MQRTVMVTGAARGIGLELCRQALQAGDTVLALPRQPGAAALAALAHESDRLHEIPMDIADEASVTAAAAAVARHVDHLDVLCNNAGVYPSKDGGVERLNATDLLHAFDVNTVGALRVVRAFLPMLRRGRDRKLVQITSLMGSIADNTSGGSYAYRMSKTALNMAVRNLAHELGPDGFVCLALHPGWVQTDMGGAAAPDGLQQACAEIWRTIHAAGPDHNGTFRNRTGDTLPF